MKSRFILSAGLLLTLAAMAGVTAARAQDDAKYPRFGLFEAVGYQASSSAPFVFEGKPIGHHAVWTLQVGPLDSSEFAAIPGDAFFGGAACKAEHSQALLTTEDGSTLTVSVYGIRCEPSDTPGAHFTHGVYSILGGTGVFKKVRGGTGSISFDAPGDGSVTAHIAGNHCPNSPVR
jgi:hypothetical protein